MEGAALKLTRSIQTAPVDLFRSAAAPRPRGHSVFAVIPYDYLVSLSDYEKYIDAYVIPQTQGWIDEQALQSYSFYLARYPAARGARCGYWKGQRRASRRAASRRSASGG